MQKPENVVSLTLQTSAKLPLDAVDRTLQVSAWVTFLVTYTIIFNWIYNGYCDLWLGVYGVDDDDDDD